MELSKHVPGWHRVNAEQHNMSRLFICQHNSIVNVKEQATRVYLAVIHGFQKDKRVFDIV